MIEVMNVTKTYGDRTVLNGLTLHIKENVCTAVCGPSGVGKTTLLRIIAGLEQPDGGSVTGIEGKRISFVFQENRLLENATVLNNLLCVGAGKDRAEELLKRCGLSEHAGKKAALLSGGMKRRLAIARALSVAADVYFLDEPLRELDEKTENDAAALIKEELRGKTVLLISHSRTQIETLADERIELTGTE